MTQAQPEAAPEADLPRHVPDVHGRRRRRQLPIRGRQVRRPPHGGLYGRPAEDCPVCARPPLGQGGGHRRLSRWRGHLLDRQDGQAASPRPGHDDTPHLRRPGPWGGHLRLLLVHLRRLGHGAQPGPHSSLFSQRH